MPAFYLIITKERFRKQNGNKKMYVFVSHRHHDHYNEEIFRLQEKFRDIQYIISSDVYELASHPEKNDKIIYMKAGEEADIKGCYVRTLRSNDEGTAFFIRYKDQTIYHAGDLNWWHWEGEPDEYNKNMRRSYQSEINKLCGEKIDAALFRSIQDWGNSIVSESTVS